MAGTKISCYLQQECDVKLEKYGIF